MFPYFEDIFEDRKKKEPKIDISKLDKIPVPIIYTRKIFDFESFLKEDLNDTLPLSDEEATDNTDSIAKQMGTREKCFESECKTLVSNNTKIVHMPRHFHVQP